MPAGLDVPHPHDDGDELIAALTQMARTLAYVDAVTRLTHQYVLEVAGQALGAPAPDPPAPCLHPAASRVPITDGTNRVHCVSCGSWVAPEE